MLGWARAWRNCGGRTQNQVLCQDCVVVMAVMLGTGDQESRVLGHQAVRSAVQAWIVGRRRRFSGQGRGTNRGCAGCSLEEREQPLRS